MTEVELCGRRLQAGDDLGLWYAALLEMADRAAAAGDTGTELLALDAAETLIALADRLDWIEQRKTAQVAARS